MVMRKLITCVTAVAAVAFIAPSLRAADIVDTAVKAGNFKTLAAALGAADLVETLKGKGLTSTIEPEE